MLVEERRRRVRAEAEFEASTTKFQTAVQDVTDGAAELRKRLEAEAFAGRQALAAELDGGTRQLRLDRDAALSAKQDALRRLDSVKRTFAHELEKAQAANVALKKTLRKLKKQRALEVEGFGRDLAALRSKLTALEPASSKRSTLAPSSRARALRVVRDVDDENYEGPFVAEE